MIIGLDEVGRGALAGPVVAASVCFEKHFKIRDRRLPVLIDDSKKLSSKQRSEASEWITQNAVGFSIQKGSVAKINKKGIVAAANYAFRKSFREVCSVSGILPDKVFVDAFYIPRLGISRRKQMAVVHGDSLIFEIAASSIIAKVYRDLLMEKLGAKRQYKQYLWDRNKGYGTKKHRQAIEIFGATAHHRTLFVRNIVGTGKT